MTELKCGNCGYWVGESSKPLAYVEHVASGYEAVIPHPRDLRLCKQCSRVSVFVPEEDLRRALTAEGRPK